MNEYIKQDQKWKNDERQRNSKTKKNQNNTTLEKKRDVEGRTGSKAADEVTEIWHDVTTIGMIMQSIIPLN